MPIKTLKIKVDEKIDRLFKNLRKLGADEPEAELLYGLIVHVAIPNLFKGDPEQLEKFVEGVCSFIKDKAYDTVSLYYIPLVIDEELEPFKLAIEAYVDHIPESKETFEELSDEILVHAILDLCAYMYSNQMKKLEDEAKSSVMH